MAVFFELVLDFGAERDAAVECIEWLKLKLEPVKIGELTIDIHPPRLDGYPDSAPTQFQVSMAPAKVAVRGGDYNRLQLTDQQISSLGSVLYDRLRGAPNYKLAMVGWDVFSWLDVDELSSDWVAEIRDGSIKGLVVQKSLVAQLPSSSHFVEFDENHVWIPYAGSKAIGL